MLSKKTLVLGEASESESEESVDKQNKESQKCKKPLPSSNKNYTLLHKTLYQKNQQFYACLAHCYRHPYEQATKDLNIMSQRLVMNQKMIQDIDKAMIKLKREQSNLDMDVKYF